MRLVAKGSEHNELHDIECVTFDEMQWHSIAAAPLPVAFRHEGLLKPQLEELASSYGGWKRQPPAPKAVARMGLESLSQDAAGAGAENDPRDAALRMQWGQLPVEARNLLLEVAREHPADPWKGQANTLLLPEKIDWQVIAVVSGEAARRTKRGDYQNTDLHFAISTLIMLFVLFTKTKPTMSGDPEFPSPICKFARAFFAIVDPKLGKTKIDSALDQSLRAWRRGGGRRRANLYESGSRGSK